MSRPAVWRRPWGLVVLALLVAAPVLLLTGPRLLGIATFWAGVAVGGLVLFRAPGAGSGRRTDG